MRASLRKSLDLPNKDNEKEAGNQLRIKLVSFATSYRRIVFTPSLAQVPDPPLRSNLISTIPLSMLPISITADQDLEESARLRHQLHELQNEEGLYGKCFNVARCLNPHAGEADRRKSRIPEGAIIFISHLLKEQMKVSNGLWTHLCSYFRDDGFKRVAHWRLIKDSGLSGGDLELWIRRYRKAGVIEVEHEQKPNGKISAMWIRINPVRFNELATEGRRITKQIQKKGCRRLPRFKGESLSAIQLENLHVGRKLLLESNYKAQIANAFRFAKGELPHRRCINDKRKARYSQGSVGLTHLFIRLFSLDDYGFAKRKFNKQGELLCTLPALCTQANVSKRQWSSFRRFYSDRGILRSRRAGGKRKDRLWIYWDNHLFAQFMKLAPHFRMDRRKMELVAVLIDEQAEEKLARKIRFSTEQNSKTAKTSNDIIQADSCTHYSIVNKYISEPERWSSLLKNGMAVPPYDFFSKVSGKNEQEQGFSNKRFNEGPIVKLFDKPGKAVIHRCRKETCEIAKLLQENDPDHSFTLTETDRIEMLVTQGLMTPFLVQEYLESRDRWEFPYTWMASCPVPLIIGGWRKIYPTVAECIENHAQHLSSDDWEFIKQLPPKLAETIRRTRYGGPLSRNRPDDCITWFAWLVDRKWRLERFPVLANRVNSFLLRSPIYYVKLRSSLPFDSFCGLSQLQRLTLERRGQKEIEQAAYAYVRQNLDGHEPVTAQTPDSCGMIPGSSSVESSIPNPQNRFFSTGLDSVDACLNGGIAEGKLIGIGAVSGFGKTALAAQLAYAAASGGRRVGYVSLQESAMDLIQRICSNALNIPFNEVIDPASISVGTSLVGGNKDVLLNLCKIEIVCPEAPISVDGLLTCVEKLGEICDVIIVDNFLDTMPEMKPNLIRRALKTLKNYARKSGKPVIVTMQVRKDLAPETKTITPDLACGCRTSADILDLWIGISARVNDHREMDTKNARVQYLTISDQQKREVVPIVQRFEHQRFEGYVPGII